ncbi:class I SAM-dependent methyltransferase [Acuticoccus mangrovi]|uniref:Class I SAM-dependent methyltransferase n=1 Tax=Acuticoccus mangrovi TaxID=2796142 RepID=A0A934MG62_9HYPH|nr:class I SAM-dependent methyltransferase [Acuticoccus mangrovi]MBJ3776218.1 class I SAM-dependent methyltransferase [Acuticoccus mangrovi]
MILSRARRRTLSFGLQTLFGVRKRGFFIPMRHAATGEGYAARPFDALAPLFAAAEPRIAAHLARIEAYRDDLAALQGPAPEPRFDQTWFPRLDAAALYALVRDAAPARIVEVGSGHSTRFLSRAIRDGDLATSLTAIDPEPRADLAGLPLTLVRRTLQDAGLAPFADIASGDLVMVDSSHVLMPGTDVDVILNHVVPRLPAGTFLAFHDIFLPNPYPPAWPFTIYNEQNAVAPLLQGRAEIVFASAHLVAAMADRLAGTAVAAMPLAEGARESLLLLRLR